METSERLKSKLVKGFTKCMLGILVFAVVIEGIVAFVVTSDEVKEVSNVATSDSIYMSMPHPFDSTIGQYRLVAVDSNVNKDTLVVNIVASKSAPARYEYSSFSKIPLGVTITLILSLIFFPVITLLIVGCLLGFGYITIQQSSNSSPSKNTDGVAKINDSNNNNKRTDERAKIEDSNNNNMLTDERTKIDDSNSNNKQKEEGMNAAEEIETVPVPIENPKTQTMKEAVHVKE